VDVGWLWCGAVRCGNAMQGTVLSFSRKLGFYQGGGDGGDGGGDGLAGR
jgi:hypothetical protein